MVTVVVTTPSTITATATDPNTVAVSVSAASTVSVTTALGASGTVTSIATTAPITGGTITGSGTIGISAATTAAAGSMSASDKTKLDGIETGAEVNNISDANATDLTDGGATSLHSHANDHARQHSITSTSDHTSTATSGQMLQADANGLPVNATNTDAQVSAAVTASHAAVTVADTTSIDLSLTGQQISAAAIFGTGAGVVAEGNHTHYSYYTLQWAIIAGWSPVDSTTYYISGKGVQDGNAARGRIYIPVSGTIVYADFNSYVGTTLASAETSSAWVRLNNTTDTLISDAIQQDTVYEQFVNSALSIAVTAGNYVEIKWTTPAWVTNPTNTRQYGFIVVRV